MPPLVLTKGEIQVVKLMREHVDNFIQVYWRTSYCEPSDAEIRAHLECRGRSDVVSWIKHEEHFKVDKLSLRGVILEELINTFKYG